MARLFCIDDEFTKEQKQLLDYWPLEGQEYTLREEITYPNGRKGFYLNEIINSHTVGNPKREPSFSINRFVVFSDPVIEEIEIELKA